jgi:hypothetical protein
MEKVGVMDNQVPPIMGGEIVSIEDAGTKIIITVKTSDGLYRKLTMNKVNHGRSN